MNKKTTMKKLLIEKSLVWKKLLIGSVAFGLLTSVADADLVLFDTGNGNTLNSSSDSFTLTINTANDTLVSSEGNVNFNNNMAITDQGNSVDDDFVLTLNAGFGFVSGAPTWDTTDDSTSNKLRIFSGRGIAPHGDNAKFGDGEILWFAVSGLATGNSLQLNGFTMFDDNGDEGDFLSYYTNGANPVLGGTITDGGVTVISGGTVLGNGDRFGIGYTGTGTANRSFISNLDIAVTSIPEPSALILFASLGLGLCVRRKQT